MEHTADWQIQVWAPDLNKLFAQAAHGMYSLSQVRLKAGEKVNRQIRLQAMDTEALLVAFLDELLFFAEQERLAFDEFDLEVTPTGLSGNLKGAEILGQQKEIKAVTFHNLAIRRENNLYQVSVVFDV